MFRIVTESGKILVEGLNERGANVWWDDCNGIWENENGEEKIYIEEMK